MTMPSGVSGLSVQQWLEDFQDNPAPPLGNWIGDFISQNNLSSLHGRTRGNIEDYYLDQVPQFSWWEEVLDKFNQILGNLPEWLSSIQPVLEWLGEKFTVSFQGIFNTAMELLSWINTNIGSPLFKTIFETLKWINDNIGEPLTKAIFNLLKGINDVIGIPVFQAILDFLNWLWTGAETAFAGFGATVESILKPLFEWLGWLWGQFGSAAETFLKPLFALLKNVWDFFVGIANQAGSTAQAWLAQIFAFLGWLWQNFGAAVNSFLKPVMGFLNWLWGQFGAVEITFLRPLFGVFKSVWDTFVAAASTIGTNATAMLNNLFGFLSWLISQLSVPNLQDIFGAFKTLIGNFGSMLNWLDVLPSHTDILGIVQSITGQLATTVAEGLGAIVEWAQNIPVIGPLISGLTNGAGTTFPDLVDWAEKQLGIDSAIPSFNLTGFIPDELMAMLPIGHVGDTQPNLVTDQAFASEAAVQAGNGWSWDGAVSRPGSSGGSAKATCTGGVNQLFSNLVAVAVNQKLDVSAYVKWTKASSIASSAPVLSVGVRAYNGESVLYTQSVATLTATGTTGGWSQISGTHTVPSSNVTHVRLVLSATNGPAGTLAWFDDATMKKTSKLSKGLVADLTSDLAELLPKINFNELLNTVANQTGATLEDVAATVTNFLNADSELNASKIASGNIGSEFISELVDTWNEMYAGISGAPGRDKNLATASAALRDFTTLMANQGSAINLQGSSIGDLSKTLSNMVLVIDNVAARATQLETATKSLQTSRNELIVSNGEFKTAIGTLQTDVKALQTKTNSPITNPTPPNAPITPPTADPIGTVPPPPQIISVSVKDEFERVGTSLGSDWIVPTMRNPDSSVFGTHDGRNAWLYPPALTGTLPVAVAVYKTPSATGYQRVYGTLSSAPGLPLFGEHGFNDLIARASTSNPLYGIVCRFYANGVIKIFYRLGAWEPNAYAPTNTLATYTSTTKPITGANLEFSAGSKTSGLNYLSCKLGTATFGPAIIDASVLNSLGLGWGFGMGSGKSGIVPQPAGKLNVWGAQDQ